MAMSEEEKERGAPLQEVRGASGIVGNQRCAAAAPRSPPEAHCPAPALPRPPARPPYDRHCLAPLRRPPLHMHAFTLACLYQ